MHCVKCSISFQVDIFLLATKDQDTIIMMVQNYRCKHQHLSIILRQFNYGKNSFIELVPACAMPPNVNAIPNNRDHLLNENNGI